MEPEAVSTLGATAPPAGKTIVPPAGEPQGTPPVATDPVTGETPAPPNNETEVTPPTTNPPTEEVEETPPTSEIKTSNSTGGEMQHRVVYTDYNVLCPDSTNGTCAADPNMFPLPAALKGFNRLILSFFMATIPADFSKAGTTGAVDKALAWTTYPERKTLKKAYADAGIKVMVAAFGATGKG